MQQENAQFFFEPFCCACGKTSENVKATVMHPGTAPIYWFLFSDPNNPDDDMILQEAQNIQTILNEVEKKNAPTHPEAQEAQGVAFMVKTTKTFN